MTVPVELASLPPTNVKTGRDTVGTSKSESSVFLSGKLTRGVLFKALNTNSGVIYIGNSGVTTSVGFPLDAGESVVVPISSGKIYVIAEAVAQELAWMTL